MAHGFPGFCEPWAERHVAFGLAGTCGLKTKEPGPGGPGSVRQGPLRPRIKRSNQGVKTRAAC